MHIEIRYTGAPLGAGEYEVRKIGGKEVLRFLARASDPDIRSGKYHAVAVDGTREARLSCSPYGEWGVTDDNGCFSPVEEWAASLALTVAKNNAGERGKN